MITLSLTESEFKIIQTAMDVAFEEFEPELMDHILEDDISSVFTKLSNIQN
jgi:hypothetical protein